MEFSPLLRGGPTDSVDSEKKRATPQHERPLSACTVERSAKTVDPPDGAHDAFSDLLRRLGEAHQQAIERAVSSLRREKEALEVQLRSLRGPTSSTSTQSTRCARPQLPITAVTPVEGKHSSSTSARQAHMVDVNHDNCHFAMRRSSSSSTTHEGAPSRCQRDTSSSDIKPKLDHETRVSEDDGQHVSCISAHDVPVVAENHEGIGVSCGVRMERQVSTGNTERGVPSTRVRVSIGDSDVEQPRPAFPNSVHSDSESATQVGTEVDRRSSMPRKFRTRTMARSQTSAVGLSPPTKSGAAKWEALAAASPLVDRNAHFSYHLEPLEHQGQLLSMWEKAATMSCTPSMRNASSMGARARRASDLSIILHTATAERQADWYIWENCLKPYILPPNGPHKTFWDTLGMVFLSYDIISIPMSVFGNSSNPALSVMQFASMSYWFIDIPVSFVTAFILDGIVQTRPVLIAKHYIRTWFVIDLIVVSMDVCTTIIAQSDAAATHDHGSYSRIGRVTRLMRLFRLLRLLKVPAALEGLTQRIKSDQTLIALGIIKLLLFIVLVNHVLACGWYAIGILSDHMFDAETWIKSNALEDHSWEYRYLTALHWSITQFTPASMEVVPTNSLERMFTVCVIFFAMVTFSSFISSITAAMQRLRTLESAKLERQQHLRQFIQQNKLSTELTACIWGHLRVCTNKNHVRLHEKDVSLLSALPPAMQAKVREQVFGPILHCHPFFKEFGSCFRCQQAKILETALEEKACVQDKMVFSPSDTADRMFFVIGGDLEYAHGQENPQPVQAASWLGEPLLWLFWEYVGNFKSITRSEVLVVYAASLVSVIRLHEQTAKYAQAFAMYYSENEDCVTDMMVEEPELDRMVQLAFASDQETWAEFSGIVPSKGFAYEVDQRSSGSDS